MIFKRIMLLICSEKFSWRRTGVTVAAISAGMCLFTWSASGPAQPGPNYTDSEIAASAAFPQSLRDNSKALSTHGGPQPIEKWVTIELPMLPGDVLPPLFVAYANGFQGAVRIVHRTPYSIDVTEGPQGLALGGMSVSGRLAQFAGTGSLHVVISYGGATGGENSWVFHVAEAGNITNIGPVEPSLSGALTVLTTFSEIDIDEDGLVEIVDTGDGGGAPGNDVYHLDQAGSFVFWKKLRFFMEVERFNNPDFPSTRSATLGTLGVATLQVRNGLFNDPDGRVRSAEVRLNGSIVVLPGAFGSDVGSLALPIDLSAVSNILEVELHDSPGKKIALMID